MRPSRNVFGYFLRFFVALFFFAAITPSLMAQNKSSSSGGGSASAPPSGGSSGGSQPHPSNTGSTGAHPTTNPAAGTHTNTGTNTATHTTTNTTASHTTGTSTAAGTHGTTAKNGTTAGAKTGTGTGAGAGKTTASLKSAAVTNGAAKASGGAGANGANAPGTTKLANGGMRTVHTDGSVVERGSNGKVTSVTTPKGTTAKMNANGKIATVSNGKGLTVNHSPTGNGRTVVSHIANGNKVVSTGKGHGYAEHHFNRGGREYARRSYYYHGRYWAHVYRPYYWHGYPYYGYVPGYYWGPAYYGWAYNPWAAPVYYNWGWGGAPWYGPYGYYFAPYPYYGAPYLWLTDYMVAATLAAAYESANASILNSNPEYVAAAYHMPDDTKSKNVVLTPEIKNKLADEIKMQIGKDKDAAAAQGGAGAQGGSGGSSEETPPSLDPDFTIFVVNMDLNVAVGDNTCALTPGDFIERETDAPGSDGAVSVKVVGSKKEDCASGSETRVQLEDLTDMYNHFREQLDAGMKELSEKQGKNGIPASPNPGMKTNPDGQAAPDLTTQSEIDKAQADADAAEKDVRETAAEDNKS